jgi:DNA polymerase III subunit chi
MKVSFYLLKENNPDAILPVICRLCAKALDGDHKIYIHCEDVVQAGKIDQLLWTFKDVSFLPHRLANDTSAPDAPIVIGTPSDAPCFDDILINCHRDIPDFHTQYQRVIECVSDDADSKQISRDHYRQYRELEYELSTHRL